jgi:hypothetical protein
MNTTKKYNKFKNKNIQYGSGAIAAGGYGCVFRPALKCKNKTQRYKGISKLMTNTYANKEYNEIVKLKKTLTKIPNNSKYFIISDIQLCKPDKLTKSDLINFNNKCSNLTKNGFKEENINLNLDKLSILNSVDGGMDLSKYLTNRPLTYNSFIELNNKLIELLQNAVVKMNKLKLFHFDIKSSNILINNTKTIRIIDWGLSQEQKNEKIPELILRRPLQFNIPLSVIILNDEFNLFIENYVKTKNVILTKDNTKLLINQWVSYFLNNFGSGHINYITYIIELIFNEDIKISNEQLLKRLKNENINPETVPSVLVPYSYFINIISDYLVDIYLNFNENNKFNAERYFNSVFSKNVDVFGLLSVYFDILEVISPDNRYSSLNKIPVNILNNFRLKLKKILYNYCFSINYASKPIDINQLILDLKSLNKLS